MKVSSATDVGCKRKNNEDFFFVDRNRNLYIIADGMGGHNAGERASKLAVETAEGFLSKEKLTEIMDDDDKIKDNLIQAILNANKSVLEESRTSRKLAGMGCTLIITFVKDNVFHISHVGDVRAYMVSGQEITLLTEDHTILFDLLKRGKITFEDTKTHPLRSMLSRSVGNKEDVEVDYNRAITTPGDYILLCSDGLNSMIEDNVIRDIVLEEKDPEKIKDSLIIKAKEAGGKDNITIVVFYMEHGNFQEEKEINLDVLESKYKTKRLTFNPDKPWWKFW